MKRERVTPHNVSEQTFFHKFERTGTEQNNRETSVRTGDSMKYNQDTTGGFPFGKHSRFASLPLGKVPVPHELLHPQLMWGLPRRARRTLHRAIGNN